jgi:uncharacterized membrane protein
MRYTIWSARVAVIAAVYAALTIAIAPLAYGEIQVRISDAMLILPLLPGYIIYIFCWCYSINY